MKLDDSEFAAIPITDDKLVAWPRVAAISAMVAFSLPTFITGLEVYQALTPMDTVWALLVGSLIIFGVGAVIGAIGARSRMSSYLLVRVAFGDMGAGIVNIAFAISLLGWFGVNINLFTDAISRLAVDAFGISLAPLPLAIGASLFMTVTTLVGFRAINILAAIMVPALVVVTAMLANSALQSTSIEALLQADKAASLSLGDGVSAVVGAIIVGAIILPDITRFIRHWRGAVYTAFISYVVIQLVVMGAASLAGASSGKTEILDIMLDLGMGIGAFIIVMAGSWVLNSLNLYSAVLGIKATFPKWNSVAITLILGAVGVGAALLNLLDQFITFLFYLSVIFIPVAGVIMSDFLLIRPHAYRLETLTQNRQLNVKGFVAWALGAVVAVLASEAIIRPLTGIAAMDAIILSAVAYIILAWNERGAMSAPQA